MIDKRDQDSIEHLRDRINEQAAAIIRLQNQVSSLKQVVQEQQRVLHEMRRHIIIDFTMAPTNQSTDW